MANVWECMSNRRICIYPKDVQRITGKSERYGRKLLAKIRTHLEKEPHQFITLQEFSDYTGIQLAEIEKYILD
jgi:Fic family protein